MPEVDVITIQFVYDPNQVGLENVWNVKLVGKSVFAAIYKDMIDEIVKWLISGDGTMRRLSLIAICLAALLTLSANHAEPPGKKDKALQPPTLRLHGISRVPAGEGHLGILFEAANPNDAPLPYHGYRADGFDPPLEKGVIAPLYHLEFKRDGAWKAEPIGWCGTGVGPVSLPPRGSAQFSVLVPEEGWEAFKVGVEGFSPADQKGKPTIAWSDPVARASIAKMTDAVGNAGTPTKVVFDAKDTRIRGFVEVLEKRGVKLAYEQSANTLRWRIVEPQFPGGELRVGICTFKESATEAQMREALSDFSGGWRHVNSHSRLAMSRIRAEGFEKGKPDDIAGLEEKLRIAFFWHQRPETRPLKNALTNEVVDAGQDPKDERIVALVGYLGRSGIKLANDKGSTGWRIVEPKHTDGILSVSIRSLPPPATEVQMRFGLDVNLYYELNVDAQLAMSRLIFRDSKEGKAPTGLESKLLRLFHEYRPAGAPSTEKAVKARDQLVKFLKTRDIDLRPVPNSTNVIQGLYSIGPDHDKQFCVGINYLPPKTADAFRKEHVGYPFAHEIRGNFVLFKVGGPNGIDTKGYDAAWKKVLGVLDE